MNPYVVSNDNTTNDLIEADFDVRKIENINLVLDEDKDQNSNDHSDDENDVSDSDEEESDDENDGSGEEESDDENDEQLEEIELNSETETTIEKIDIPHMDEDDNIDYKKMNVAQLRDLVVFKGLSNNANKLKKRELFDLLTQ